MIRASRTVEDAPRMAKGSQSKETDELFVPMRQTKSELHRYRLQVDRQTKNSYVTLQEAETVGKALKAAYPVVQVSIYDADKRQQKLVTV